MIEEPCEKIEIPLEETKPFSMNENYPADTQSIASARNSQDSNRQYTNEVQSFVQKKNIAQG